MGRTEKNRSTVVFLSPWLISFGIFWVFPLVFSLVLSFLRFNPLRPDLVQFVGLSNFSKALTDPLFWTSLKNTLVFVGGTVPVTTLIAFFLAVAINQRIPFRSFYRSGFFIPSIISIVVISIIFKQLYAPAGLVNKLVELLGGEGRSWLGDPRTSLLSIMVMDIWASFGYYTILFLAGLQAIPSDLYEAAHIDGGGFWDTLRFITVPMIRPITLFVVVINTIRSFQIFIEIFVMTRGGPLNSTLTSVFYLYDRAFYRFEMGYASAIAYLLFMVIMTFSVLQMKYLRVGRAAGE
ncbi:MAG: sugar ABC transporter permease [Candidatus Eiseniibacteriota bacterium]|nr:MAG: sugar ABC transporter permease [Candidatus Eisenbacteria bacterium]